ncbi:MAG: hypothetical protein AB1Z67_00305 [Candidatus Limnocylindrales bacterium]
MTLRPLLALALVVTLAPPAAVSARDDAEATVEPAPPSPVASADTRLADLEALVPEFFAGLPLRENAQVAPGEMLISRMDDEERAAFEAMLAANGKSLADYAAANIVVRIDDASVVVIQPHRVAGIDAAATLEAWGDILGLDAERPTMDTVRVAGREVLRVSDEARDDFPSLHLFAGGDVVWMVLAGDAAVIEEAVRTLSAASVPAADG